MIEKNVDKTLYIPLFGKALVSKKGIIIDDPMAEQIWGQVQFKLKGKAKSKWLAYYMGMRSAVFDEWTANQMAKNPNAVILHLGCGLDSRFVRVGKNAKQWVDVDLDKVIQQRKNFYQPQRNYQMLGADISENGFVDALPQAQGAIVILEGVSMYLTNQTLQQLFAKLKDKYCNISILVDCYTPFAVKMSKVKNPVNQVGVKTVYGVKNPQDLCVNTQVKFVKEWQITPQNLVDQLTGLEKLIFKNLYAGKISKALYKLYEYN